MPKMGSPWFIAACRADVLYLRIACEDGAQNRAGTCPSRYLAWAGKPVTIIVIAYKNSLVWYWMTLCLRFVGPFIAHVT